jgi:hypothetical protein
MSFQEEVTFDWTRMEMGFECEQRKELQKESGLKKCVEYV